MELLWSDSSRCAAGAITSHCSLVVTSFLLILKAFFLILPPLSLKQEQAVCFRGGPAKSPAGPSRRSPIFPRSVVRCCQRAVIHRVCHARKLGESSSLFARAGGCPAAETLGDVGILLCDTAVTSDWSNIGLKTETGCFVEVVEKHTLLFQFGSYYGVIMNMRTSNVLFIRSLESSE